MVSIMLLLVILEIPLFDSNFIKIMAQLSMAEIKLSHHFY